MDWIIPVIIVLGMSFFLKRLKKIPQHVRSTPALEIECPLIYDVIVTYKGKDIITLDSTGAYKKDPRVLKNKSSKTEYDVLIDLSDILNFGDDVVEFDVRYQENGKKVNVKFISPTLELDFATAYINNGKLLDDCEVMEKKIKLSTEGKQAIRFQDLSTITKERDRWRRRV